MFSPEDVLGLPAWAAPEAVHRALCRELDAQPVRAYAMPAQERVRRVAELEAQLLEYERAEETLIMRRRATAWRVLSRFRGTFHSFDPVGFAIFAIPQAASVGDGPLIVDGRGT
jgi:hypothetical protein